jgi:hypothetical protein
VDPELRIRPGRTGITVPDLNLTFLKINIIFVNFSSNWPNSSLLAYTVVYTETLEMLGKGLAAVLLCTLKNCALLWRVGSGSKTTKKFGSGSGSTTIEFTEKRCTE